jgi:hypothetical protein
MQFPPSSQGILERGPGVARVREDPSEKDDSFVRFVGLDLKVHSKRFRYAGPLVPVLSLEKGVVAER